MFVAGGSLFVGHGYALEGKALIYDVIRKEVVTLAAAVKTHAVSTIYGFAPFPAGAMGKVHAPVAAQQFKFYPPKDDAKLFASVKKEMGFVKLSDSRGKPEPKLGKFITNPHACSHGISRKWVSHFCMISRENLSQTDRNT